MTVPVEYEQASTAFRQFLMDLRDRLDLQTTNQAWGVLLGVFEAFRRRLTVPQALAFAKALPPLLRAAFVADWNPQEPPPPFRERADLDDEVMAFHRDHQFASAGAIEGAAAVVRCHVDAAAFARALDLLPLEARMFWSVDDPRRRAEDAR